MKSSITHEEKLLAADTFYCRIAGVLDAGTSIEMERVLGEPLRSAAVKRVILDVPALNFVSSSGLRIFMLIIKALTPRKGQLFIVGAVQQVEQLVNTSGMSKWIILKNTVEECQSE